MSQPQPGAGEAVSVEAQISMHFESGGTLVTLDPKTFGEAFTKEFWKAGGDASEGAAAV